MARALAMTDLHLIPPPVRPDWSAFVVATDDIYVPLAAAEPLWRVVRDSWAGCEWWAVPGGHILATLFPRVSAARAAVHVPHDLSSLALHVLDKMQA
jgi:hypothetical protein